MLSKEADMLKFIFNFINNKNLIRIEIQKLICNTIYQTQIV